MPDPEYAETEYSGTLRKSIDLPARRINVSMKQKTAVNAKAVSNTNHVFAFTVLDRPFFAAVMMFAKWLP